MLYKCPYCLSESEELTKEHIIPNSIGGVKYFRGICKECNDEFGKTIDIGICNDFGYIMNLFCIKRGDGEIPKPFGPVEDNYCNKYLIGFGGIPIPHKVEYVEEEEDGKRYIRMVCRDIEEAKLHIKNLCKKYGDDSEVSDIRKVKRYIDEVKWNIEIGKPEQLRAIAKIAFNYLISNFGDICLSEDFNEIRSFIRYGSNQEMPLVVFDPFDYKEPSKIIDILDHSISIFKVGYEIYSIIKIFGDIKFSVLISSSNKNLPIFGKTYIFDNLNRYGEEYDFNPLFSPPPLGYIHQINNSDMFKLLLKGIVLKSILKAKKFQIEKRISEIVNKNMEDLSSMDDFSDSDLERVVNNIVSEIDDWLMRRTKEENIRWNDI